jgi:hypothetical protein
MLQRYSELFSTVHDEPHPVGHLGRGTHYSILRAISWTPDPHFHDIAVIWDEDHDTRVIWVAEQLLVGRLLGNVVFIGERKGGITALTRHPPSQDFETELARIAESVPSDCFTSTVECLPRAASIVDDKDARVVAYLAGIDAIWNLGPKPLAFSTEPFRDPGAV